MKKDKGIPHTRWNVRDAFDVSGRKVMIRAMTGGIRPPMPFLFTFSMITEVRAAGRRMKQKKTAGYCPGKAMPLKNAEFSAVKAGNAHSRNECFMDI